ncbi:hypothetical protein CDAR_1911 [Caerostris darwini]|uniref:Transposase n=1 Tax=Caerostris darwini TaxID=1538125 RepID=A0AAV4R9Z9_9ARAC|nr:hypothetical protein CDAR_1911 [Caerostris darwini]
MFHLRSATLRITLHLLSNAGGYNNHDVFHEVTAEKDQDEIIYPNVILYRGCLGDDFELLNDNTQQNQSRLVEIPLDIELMDWIARALNYNSIKYLTTSKDK